MARLSVAMLGPPDVRHGQQVLTFPTRKALAVLLYLLAEGGAQPRDKLAALFWPESDADAARATLRSTLARLREGLEGATDEPHLIVDRAAVAFDTASEFDLDLHRLDAAYGVARTLNGAERPAAEARQEVIARLHGGADAWRGEFLEGFSLRDAPDFDEWSSVQREHWRRRMETVLDRLSRLQADAGDAGNAIETATRWLRLTPLEERAYRRLMRLHFAAGNRAAALQTYDTCVTVLEAELGTPPDPETAALAERIRASPRAGGAPDRRRPAAAPAALDPPLVGRGDEFATLVERYHTARGGRPQAAVLQGEAGIGKTRLATEFLAWAAAQGADVLPGRAFETGAHLPYQPLVDALRPRLEHDPAPAATLGTVWRSELSRVLPELRERDPVLTPPGGDEAAARPRLFEAVARLGVRLAAAAPLVILIDDVQWADGASLDVLRYAARRWAQEDAGILLLVCVRAEALAASPALADWLLALDRDLGLARIDLGPLSYAETLQMVRELAPERAAEGGIEPLARWLFAETAGQPFYLAETLRMLRERGRLAALLAPGGDGPESLGREDQGALLPPSVRQIIQIRLAPLPPTGRELLAAAAVLGQGFTFDLLCRVGKLTEEEALPALDAVLRGHLLRETGAGEYLFAHDKIRDVVAAEAGEARRRVFHRRALEALEAARAPAAELARHALGAGLDEPALRHSIAAGDEAMRLLAARDAAEHYARALALAGRLGRDDLLAELHARRGRAFIAMGAWSEARRELNEALAGFQGNRERAAEVLADVTEACWWALAVPAVLRHAGEALALARELGRGDLETKAIAWQAAAEGALGDLPRCDALIREAIARSRAVGIAAPTIAGHYRPLTLYWLGRPGEAIDFAREAVAVARERNDMPWLLTALPNLGLALAATGDYAGALAAFAEARTVGREYGLDTLLARAISISTGFHFELFDFAGAGPLAREARDLARAANFPPPAVSAGIDLLFTFARQGEEEIGKTEGLVDEVAAAIEETGGFHRWQWGMRLAAARAEIALARGETDEALHWANETITQSRARGRPKYEAIGLTARAAQLLALGRAKEAIVDLQTAVVLARRVGDPALLLQPAALLLPVAGDDALAGEARAAVAKIAAALPDEVMRHRFADAAPVRIILGQ
jgi:DNA-binding SARP family transcriptional activator